MDPIIDAALHGEFSEFTRLLNDRKSDNHARLPPSDEPLGWAKDRNKLVRLDHAIMACHVLVARVAFGSLPAMARQRLFDFKRSLVERVAFALIKKAAGLALKAPKYLYDEVTGYLKADSMELEAEQAIRRQSIRIMRDLRKQILFQGVNPRRKTKLVFTRNPGPPQRRPNRKWRSPKAKRKGYT